MAIVTDFAIAPQYLSEAFATQSTSLQVLLTTNTQVVIRNPETEARTILTGTGLSASVVNGQLQVTGLLTGVEIRVLDGGSLVPTAQLTDISWNAANFILAVNDLIQFGDLTGLDALLSLQPVTYDASDAVQGVTGDFRGVTSNVSVFGSAFDDWLSGGSGDDLIKPGANNPIDFSADLLVATLGNDIYDLRDTTPFAFNELIYGELSGPIIANIDGSADTGTVLKIGDGTDTILGVRTAMTSDGIAMQGTDYDDQFNVTGVDGGYVEIIGASGADSYDLTIAGTVRLNFAYSWNFSPFEGLVINLGTQQIANDGYGNSETLSLTDAGGWLEIMGTDLADNIIGSDQGERFILRGGNDTLDGGGGFDLLRYDRNQMTSGVSVDLQTGIATGAWESVRFTNVLSGIEEIRGTRTFSDTIRGSAADELLDGRGGNDVIDGRGGNDTLIGGDGNDSLVGSVGDDELIGDNGNDTLVGGLGNDYLEGGNGNDRLDASADATGWGDFVRPGLGTNTIIGNAALFNTFGDGIDLSYSDLSGIGGLTIRVNASGAGTTRSGQTGLVNDTFTFAHYFIGSQDADLIIGANEATGDANAFRFEGYSGQAGNDTIFGGSGGFDQLSYRNDEDGNDNPFAVVVNFAIGEATDTYGDTDTFFGIEGVEGTSLGDQFFGSESIEYLQYRGYAGNDTIFGSGDGYDDLDYSNDAEWGGASGIIADLSANEVVDGFGSTDTVVNIDGIRGTQFDDSMTAEGTITAIRFQGGEGNDTLIGGLSSDELDGGNGDDFLDPGDNTDIDFIRAGAGNDTISFADLVEGFVEISHDDLNAGIALVVNGSTNIGSVNKGVNGTTTLIDVINPISAGAGPFGGLGIVGTDFNDTFTVTNSVDGYVQLMGGRGNDTFIGIDDLNSVRLRYDVWNVANGIRMNLATGVVSNDGFGFVDTLSIAGPARFDEIQATRFADVIVGSAVGTETYILQGGNDTLTGGGGYDVVRYDRNGVGPVNVDLAAQTATGTWNGVAFTNRLVDVDEVRGSNTGNDTLLGDGFTNLLNGREGNDILDGRGGNDTLEGEVGNDRLTGGAGADTLYGGEGNDLILVGSFADHAAGEEIEGGDGTDELRFTGAVAGTLVLGAGVDVERVVIGTGTAAAAVLTGTAAISVDASALAQGVTLVGNAGANRLTGTALGDSLEGGSGNDTLMGGAGDDTLVGGLGNDVLTGGIGADEFVFRSRTSGVDTVSDFNTLDGGGDDGDILVFEGLGVGTFTYLGAGAFTGGSDNSEARISGNLVLVDTNGDGTTDITVALTGLNNSNQLTVDDFLFV